MRPGVPAGLGVRIGPVVGIACTTGMPAAQPAGDSGLPATVVVVARSIRR